MSLPSHGRQAIQLLREYGAITYDGTQRGNSSARKQLKAWQLKRLDLMRRIAKEELRAQREVEDATKTSTS